MAIYWLQEHPTIILNKNSDNKLRNKLKQIIIENCTNNLVFLSGKPFGSEGQQVYESHIFGIPNQALLLVKNQVLERILKLCNSYI